MLLSPLLLALCQVSLPAQATAPRPAGPAFESMDNGLRMCAVRVPGSRYQCLALVVRIGRKHDPRGATGMAEVVGAALALIQEGHSEQERFQVVVKDAFTLLWTTAPVADVPMRLQFLAGVLGGSLEVDDDLLERARAIAALRADDDSMIFPGPILRQKAQRSLLAGTPRGRQSLGIPSEIASIPIPAIRERLRTDYRPGRAILGLLGGLGEELGDSVEVLASIPAGDAPAPVAVAWDPLESPEDTAPNPHVDGPFVSAALGVPERDSEDFLPFLVAMEVLRTRAATVFRAYRGGEHLALFPFVDYSFMDGDRIALINRRGENSSTPADVRAEVTGFLDMVQQAGISQRDVRSAATTAARQLALPPYEERLLAPMVQQKEALYPRDLVLCMYELWGWPTDLPARIRNVSGDAVREVLARYCDPRQLRWFALVPE